MNDLRPGLIAYGMRRMAQATGVDAASLVTEGLGEGLPELDAEAFEGLLGVHERSDERLRAVLSLVDFGEEGMTPSPACYRPERLVLDKKVIFPEDSAGTAVRAGLGGLWEGFADECREALRQDDGGFLRFIHLMRRYAWALPCTYGEVGVSLFEQFKAVAAMVFASRSLEKPAEEFLLVGGDIPGIQDFIYTITSKGAAKGLRGRSFFIQLLGDAVVRRLVADLRLCPANVIYAAGGNFMVLAPGEARDVVDKVRREINGELLEVFEGDLYLCLAAESLPSAWIGDAAFATEASRKVKQAIAQQKRQRFREEACKDWTLLFRPKGKGGTRYCAVCQRELGEGEGTPIEEEFIPPQGPSRKCDHCAQFEKLAGDIAYDDLLLGVSLQHPREAGEAWQENLYRVTGVWYDFVRQGEGAPSGASVYYAVNEPGFLDAGADGFLFQGNTTPREKYTIKTFGEMADDAAGIKRVGVLRMDVDDFGRAMVVGLERRTMALTSALSSALELFFGGWLNEICREVQASREVLPESFKRDSGELLYIIYSGGDDLFIVGTWDRLPVLAERIHSDFATFTGRNPNLHISAGLTLERRKFPLYRAAERAHDALEDGAKEYARPDGEKKDAITFLGQTVAWEDFAPLQEDRFGVKGSTRRLVDLVDGQVPRSLLQVVQSIYGQYQRDLEHNLKRWPTSEQPEQLYYGRWMWMRTYQMSRLMGRHKEVSSDIEQLQRGLMNCKNVCHSGLAARWAEYLTRKEREHGEETIAG